MTCKDCIHNEMCYGTHTDDSPTCCDFKNKSRYIEVVRCGNCRWWKRRPNSAQGRCELGGFYPTSMWYCANGEGGEIK